MIALAAAAVVGVGGAMAFRRGPDTQYLTSKVQQGDIRDAVDATGTVEPVDTVQVGAQVSGRISALHADFNSRVHKGDVVAEIDPALFKATLQQAEADLKSAHASVTTAQAAVAKAEATLQQTKADYDRTSALARTQAESEQVLEQSRATYEAAQADVQAAAAGVVQAQAVVSQKEAAVSVAQTNLGYTVIHSPIDGVVVARNVDVGQTVAASLQAPTIFTIARDLGRMVVYTSVDESDVGRIHVGAQATFKVDAFPKDRFTGVVSQLRMNPTTVQNVVTYNAVVAFANPELKLFPGMTAYVNVPVATATNVVKVPNAALRFHPPLPADAVRALYASVGINPDAATASDNSGNTARPTSAIVWKLLRGAPLPVELSLGITDHAYTEVRTVDKGSLHPGDDLVTTAIVQNASGGPGAAGAGGRR
ncbi:MAG: efflux RND transporter periplasmic adaptor subunit [Gemmatimonadota bacterium]|nr:efflux RND transporter periplasmic adaptor subunit [Gemmatimonadota bacterium]